MRTSNEWPRPFAAELTNRSLHSSEVGKPTFEPLTRKWRDGLADLFNTLRSNSDESFFHPHMLTSHEADVLSRYEGEDLYFVAINDGRVIGYGMLRGWAEGL